MNVQEKILDRLRIMAGSVDLWAMLLTVLYAFGKPIPWWAWVAFGLEVVLTILIGIKERLS